MEDIVPGYNEVKDTLMAKLEEPIQMYLLCKLKLAQLRAGASKHPAIEREFKENIMFHAREINERLLQDIENQ